MTTAQASTLSRTAPADQTSRVQIEITTICNFDCFYCAGRQMQQRHMGDSVFEGLLAKLPLRPGATVSLQGEGEPTLHPRFWEWVDAVRGRGWMPYTITNGSRVDVDRFNAKFPRVGLSLDTLDAGEARRIGRYNLRKVMRNLESLVRTMGGARVVVHTTSYGQPLDAVKDYVRGLGVTRHICQGLQTKDDYASHYSADKMAKPLVFVPPPRLYRCRYLEQPVMRYYDLNGTEMPCCFIKDASVFSSIGQLRDDLDARRVPPACRGCRELH